MAEIKVVSSAIVGAPAEVAYNIIADYRAGHPQILPPKYFQQLRVLKGGVGEGTHITFIMKAFGKLSHLDAVISEPELGRLIHEYYPEQRMLTTFTVNPRGAECEVIITTGYQKPGIVGWLESLLVPGYLRKVFAEELQLLDRVARGSSASR